MTFARFSFTSIIVVIIIKIHIHISQKSLNVSCKTFVSEKLHFFFHMLILVIEAR